MRTDLAIAMGEANRHRKLMVFDWNKAAELIKESGYKNASAGLYSDWEWTGGYIFINGEPDYDSYTYLASTWATPQIEIDGNIYECWCYSDEWDASTKWPESALNILRENA